jgi:ribosome biogenesis protein ERB1
MKVRNIKRNFKEKTAVIPRAETDSSSSSNDSDNEVVMNRRGVIPREWFEDQEMQGYDLDAQKVMRAKQSSKLEEFVKKAEDPNWWRTIRDELNEKDVVLTDEQLDLLDRIRNRRYAT